MRKKVIFKDSQDDVEISVSTCTDGENYILDIAGNDIWFSPEDFTEFLNECQRFYVDHEKRKNELPQGEK